MGELTRALAQLRSGDSDTAAINNLFNATYGELKRLAHQRLQNDRPGGLIDTTSIVHESYLRFLGAERLELHDRAHFFAYASKVMRSVVIDIARRAAADRAAVAELVAVESTTPDTVASLEIDKPSILLTGIGQSAQLNAQLRDAQGQPLAGYAQAGGRRSAPSFIIVAAARCRRKLASTIDKACSGIDQPSLWTHTLGELHPEQRFPGTCGKRANNTARCGKRRRTAGPFSSCWRGPTAAADAPVATQLGRTRAADAHSRPALPGGCARYAWLRFVGPYRAAGP